MAAGGAQEYLDVIPDLAVLGKALGGGMPISALVGKRAVMAHLRPLGDSEMSGTYLAHPTTVLAAQAALAEYSRPGFYTELDARCERFYGGFEEIIAHSALPLRLQYLGPRFGLYFGITDPVTNYRQAAAKDAALELAFIAGCIERGVYFHASPHHGFSAVHTDADLDQVLEVIGDVLSRLKSL